MGLPRRREFESSPSCMFMLCFVLFSIRFVSVLPRLICDFFSYWVAASVHSVRLAVMLTIWRFSCGFFIAVGWGSGCSKAGYMSLDGVRVYAASSVYWHAQVSRAWVTEYLYVVGVVLVVLVWWGSLSAGVGCLWTVVWAG